MAGWGQVSKDTVTQIPLCLGCGQPVIVSLLLFIVCIVVWVCVGVRSEFEV